MLDSGEKILGDLAFVASRRLAQIFLRLTLVGIFEVEFASGFWQESANSERISDGILK